MNAEPTDPSRRRAFAAHVTLFVGGAVLGALGLGGTWRGGVAAAGLCWVVAGALAFVARRTLLVPNAFRGLDVAQMDRARRLEMQRASAYMAGIMLILVGLAVTVFGWGWIVSG